MIRKPFKGVGKAFTKGVFVGNKLVSVLYRFRKLYVCCNSLVKTKTGLNHLLCVNRNWFVKLLKPPPEAVSSVRFIRLLVHWREKHG